MFNVGDLIIYSTHGVCHIDNISEKTFSGVTKTYYELHPLNNVKLKISAPVGNKSISMLEIMNKDEAEDILQLFEKPGIEWIEKNHQRTQEYSQIVELGNRKEAAKVINTLMRKKQELERNGKKFPEYDRKLLLSLESTLFSELAIALEATIEDIYNHVIKSLNFEEETAIL